VVAKDITTVSELYVAKGDNARREMIAPGFFAKGATKNPGESRHSN
jgi:hypothetical protein